MGNKKVPRNVRDLPFCSQIPNPNGLKSQFFFSSSMQVSASLTISVSHPLSSSLNLRIISHGLLSLPRNLCLLRRKGKGKVAVCRRRKEEEKKKTKQNNGGRGSCVRERRGSEER
jgi:hypothetical protein